MTFVSKFGMFMADEMAQLLIFLWFIAYLFGNLAAVLEKKWSAWESARGVLILFVFLGLTFVAWIVLNSPAIATNFGWLNVGLMWSAAFIFYAAVIFRLGRRCLKLLHSDYFPAPPVPGEEET